MTLSYFPIAHMVWGGGFLGAAANGISGLLFDGDPLPIDYAGGTVVHINAGVAGLVLVLILGKRLGFGKEPMKPHNLTLTMLGAGLLWFGWYGFNVGSIVFGGESPEADASQFINETSLVWLNTTLATCAAMLGWLLVEKIRDGKATSLGAASGVVAGLVAITPACGALAGRRDRPRPRRRWSVRRRGRPEVQARVRRLARRRRRPPGRRSRRHHRSRFPEHRPPGSSTATASSSWSSSSWSPSSPSCGLASPRWSSVC